MARAIWSGAISFGLINIPVEVMGAQEEKRLSFHLLDQTDRSPVGYKKINKNTGREVSFKKMIKGYEYEPHKFVEISEADFKRANPKATQTIDIEDFVELDQLDILMFEKPYYLVPSKSGRKGYVLLHRVLEETGKVAIAQFVMRAKQHLVAIIPKGPYLILELLRYAHEVRQIEEADFVNEKDLNAIRISPKELSMAEALVKGMTSKWKPEKYKDTYQNDLLRLIKRKIQHGDTEEVHEVENEPVEKTRNVVDLMPLLQKSLAQRHGHNSKTRKKSSHRGHHQRAT